MQVQVHSIHFDADQKLVSFIQEKIAKLGTFHDQIIGGEVFLRLEKSDTNENKVTEIKLLVPGKDLFAKRQSKSFEESTDDAVEALRRQIVKQRDKSRAHWFINPVERQKFRPNILYGRNLSYICTPF